MACRLNNSNFSSTANPNRMKGAKTKFLGRVLTPLQFGALRKINASSICCNRQAEENSIRLANQRERTTEMCNCFLSCIPALRHRAAPRPPQDSNFNPSKKSRAPSGLGTSNGSQTPSDLETLETQETQTEEGKADPICWRDEM